VSAIAIPRAAFSTMWSMKSLGPWIHKLVASVALAAVVTMMVALCSRTAAFSDYELWGYDFLVTHRSAERALSDVVIVDFDDAAFERLKQYPIPRNVVAEVISRVAASSPRVIGVDLFLSEPRTASEDTAMRMALGEAGNVVLASQSAAGGVPHLLPLRDFCDPETPSSDAGYCKEGSKSALGYAVVNLPVDSDGFVRSFFLFAGNPRNGVSFPVMLAQLARGESIKPGNEKTVIFLGRKISAFPDPARRALIGTWCPRCIKHLSANLLLDHSAEKIPELSDKIVIIGQSNDAARDLMLTPLFRPQPADGPRVRLSGAEIHAAAINTLLLGAAVTPVPAAILWTVLFGVAFLAVWIQLGYSLRFAVASTGALMLVIYAVSQGLFSWERVWLRYTALLAGVAMSVPVTVAYRFIRERIHRLTADVQRQEMMGLFRRYLSPEVAEEVWERRAEVVLEGQEKIATVLFSDIRNFTASTAGKDSRVVLRWLNEYLGAMDEVIRAHGGFLNKFIGDGLMVIFGVPLSSGVEEDACQALRCARKMLAKVEDLNRSGESRDFPDIKIGIGLHTGTLTCGNIGSRNRLEYSVIGETVNLASRLETLTKEFKTDVVMSAATYAAVKKYFADLPDLGKVAVRGFAGEMHLYGAPALDSGIIPHAASRGGVA
jgi:adenylate cyclase